MFGKIQFLLHNIGIEIKDKIYKNQILNTNYNRKFLNYNHLIEFTKNQ